MTNYLFDTNICIFHLKGLYNLKEKINALAFEQRFISEVTLAELKFGIANSPSPDKVLFAVNELLSEVSVLSIYQSLDTYAIEKVRLRKSGLIIPDFDLLIAATAVSFDMVCVTNNTKHFSRIENIILEDWTK